MLNRRLQPFYTADDDGGAGSGGTDKGQESDGSSKPASDAESKFTQAEVNRIVEGRLAKYRSVVDKEKATLRDKYISEYRDEMGIDDDALAKITKHDDVTREMRSIKAEATKARKEAERLSAENARILGVLEDTKTKEAVFSAAASKARDPEAVYALLRSKMKFDVDSLDVTIIGDDGEPAHGLTIDKSIDNLLAAKPFLAMPTGNPGAGSGVKEPAKPSGDKRDFSKYEDRIAKLREAFGSD